MPSVVDRCDVHHTALEIDAIRGLVCPHCDQAATFWPPGFWSRVWRWVRGYR